MKGPSVTVSASCEGCVYLGSYDYRAMGEVCHGYVCVEPSMVEGQLYGKLDLLQPVPPPECPFLLNAAIRAAQAVGGP